MDHFEGLICTLLEAEGFWIRRSFKVNVTKDEKREIGKPTIPRPEIDILAFRFSDNSVIAVEVKSYLDSAGLKFQDFKLEHDVPEGRYKLFTTQRYRSIVLARLHQDLIAQGMANAQTKISLGLAVGKLYQNKDEQIRQYMRDKNMFFWSPNDIKQRITALADRDYENDPAIMVAKVLLR